MKNILLFGAGKSSTCLIEYLINQLPVYNWQLTVIDANLDAARSKIGDAPQARAVAIQIEDENARHEWISKADIVISLLPPSLHFIVAQDCVNFSKHLLTASYVDKQMRSLQPAIESKNLIFLCEMGLDPGIDHMSAMQIIHRLHDQGGYVTSFQSHCGGLVAPESDNNPWRYKVSWNPRNIVMAGKSGAVYMEGNLEKWVPYEELFDSTRVVTVPRIGSMAWYPNRDSLEYLKIYDLRHAGTFVRTTLRFPEFCFGWKNIVQLKLTDETVQYSTNGMTLKQFFQRHLNNYGFSQWIEKQLTEKFVQTKLLLEKLQQLLSAEQVVDDEQIRELREFMMVNGKGELMDVNLEEVKTKAAATVAGQMHEANLSIKQLFFLGMDDDETMIDKGYCSAADVLQFALEKKLALLPEEHDMVVMLHEIEYVLNGKTDIIKSTLIAKGENSTRTAMAKTVGLPLGIATKLILLGQITTPGLHIPVIPEIYDPVLKELKEYGIEFFEGEE